MLSGCTGRLRRIREGVASSADRSMWNRAGWCENPAACRNLAKATDQVWRIAKKVLADVKEASSIREAWLIFVGPDGETGELRRGVAQPRSKLDVSARIRPT